MASKRSRSKKKKQAGPKPAIRSTAPETPPSPRAKTLAWIGFSAVLLLCCAWVATHAYLVDAVTVRYCAIADKDIPVEKRMPVFLSEIAFDGYTWNRHAEHLGENGEWRLRYTDFDNAPKGREQIAWNSGFAWYLRGLGEIYRAINGDSLRNSIFRMSIWANPIILVLALGIFAPLAARRFGPLCGTVIAIGLVSVPTFYEGFMPAYPDHHGLVAFSILGMIFGIAWAGAGWVQRDDAKDFASAHSLKQARHGMIFSAICGAAGLWISPFSVAVPAFGIGIAVITATAVASLQKKKQSPVFYHPELWEIWGIVTALVGLAFYLLEYFPFHLRLGLEANHPAYLLAWYAGGAGICHVTRWLMSTDRKTSTFPAFRVFIYALACALIPLSVLIWKERVYILMDPFQLRLSAQIVETLPLLTRIKMGSLTWQMAFGWFPLFLAAAFFLQFVSAVGRGTKAVLIFLSIPVFLITALQFYQVRWGMLSGPLYIALAGIVTPQIWRLIPRTLWARLLAAVLFVGVAFLFVAPSFANNFSIPWMQYRNKETISPTPGQMMALLHRQMARAILDSANGKPVVLLSSPNSSCLLSAIGGFRTIGTLYWDNFEGLKSAATGLNSQSSDEALAFMKDHGITHISLMTWENFIEPYFRMIYPKPVPGKSFENSFGKRALGDKQIPPWTRPLIFPPNSFTKALNQQVLLLQVLPDQSLDEAKFHLARFVNAVEGNPVQAEMTFKEILEESPDSNLVRVELANLYVEQHRYDEAVDQMEKALAIVTPEVRANYAGQLANALKQSGQWAQLNKLLRWAAEFPDATPMTLQNTAWLLSTNPDSSIRDPKFALTCCERLEKLPHDVPSLFLTRAAILGHSGDFSQAIALAKEAAAKSSDPELKRAASDMVAAFESGKPWAPTK